jgi:hypothetical protein
MKVIVTTLTMVIITSAAFSAPPSYTNDKSSTNEKFITPVKEDAGKDSSTVKKKDEKSFKETMRFLLLKFEK